MVPYDPREDPHHDVRRPLDGLRGTEARLHARAHRPQQHRGVVATRPIAAGGPRRELERRGRVEHGIHGKGGYGLLRGDAEDQVLSIRRREPALLVLHVPPVVVFLGSAPRQPRKRGTKFQIRKGHRAPLQDIQRGDGHHDRRGGVHRSSEGLQRCARLKHASNTPQTRRPRRSPFVPSEGKGPVHRKRPEDDPSLTSEFPRFVTRSQATSRLSSTCS